MDRYICIHGHFYQPPRENPWLEAIELQDSAFPYHDWNERITDECYRQNQRSRILDDDGRITRMFNNYSRISFNFGPTLLSWLKTHAWDVYEAILEADRMSIERFSGHGSAMAQAHNHMIMPLANDRDRKTQVVWGIRDFEHHFGRKPEGMWLPETAVNTETLEILAAHDIRFTVLAPRQAKRVKTKAKADGEWQELHGTIDPSRAYELALPSGRTIAAFFYDGPISQAVAFERLLNSGRAFADRLKSGFHEKRNTPELMHIATDGETYGHHHRHGDMALAAALEILENDASVALTNYGEFLEKHPPDHLVEIVEDSSWSCVHGVERWRADCGCHSGAHEHWNQQWRAPLREALDWLRDTIAPRYEDLGEELFKDPWAARDDYIDVIHDRSDETMQRFFDLHGRRVWGDDDRMIRALKLLELQRHAMLMYTSCGWFFDDLSGIETVQVIQYAGRVIQLAQELFGENYEEEFLRRLEQARSNLPEHGNGRTVYEKFVKPAFVDLLKVGAHFALSSLFEEYGESALIYCYDVDVHDTHEAATGHAQLRLGRVQMTSQITRETARLSYAALHLGDHVMNGAVRHFQDDQHYQQLVDDASAMFDRAEFTNLLRLMDASFGGSVYSLGTLFRDEQRHVINLILETTLEQLESQYRQIYENHAPLMRFLGALDIPAPRALRQPAEFTLNSRFRDALSDDPPDVQLLRQVLHETQQQSLELDRVQLSFVAEHTLLRMADRLSGKKCTAEVLADAHGLIELIHDLPFEVDLADLQTAYYNVMQKRRPEMAKCARGGDACAVEWVDVFDQLGALLRVRTPS